MFNKLYIYGFIYRSSLIILSVKYVLNIINPFDWLMTTIADTYKIYCIIKWLDIKTKLFNYRPIKGGLIDTE